MCRTENITETPWSGFHDVTGGANDPNNTGLCALAIFRKEENIMKKTFKRTMGMAMAAVMSVTMAGVMPAAEDVGTSVEFVGTDGNTYALTEREFEQSLREMANLLCQYYPNYTDIIERKYDVFVSDEMMMNEFEYSPKDAMINFELAVEAAVGIAERKSIDPTAYTPIPGGMLYYCNVDATIEQEENDWCGMASTLMALTGIENCNRSALISGYKRPTQSQIDKEVAGTDGTGVVYKIKNYLNTQIKSSYTQYRYEAINSSVTKYDVEEWIIDSLSKNRPVILHSKPYRDLDYYSDISFTKDEYYDSGHYLVVEEYNSATDRYTIADCTYIGTYQGRHTGVTLDEIYNSLTNKSETRHIICG